MGREANFPACAIAIVIACGDSPREIPVPPPPTPSHLELTIASQLSATLGRSAIVSCTPSRCVADLGDATLPLAITNSPDGWTWQVSGLLVRAQPIEDYLRDALDDLGAKQRLTCGAAIRSVEPGARIECTLEHGGKAFATIRANGAFTTEIVLDPAAASARSQEPPPQMLLDRGSGSGADGDD
ncbi:MAG: hypothetical protein H0V17_36485 [Deltaproteobacteria bacterium]|nr:hypothetical protein [Deltaproteobacteria bacterium]